MKLKPTKPKIEFIIKLIISFRINNLFIWLKIVLSRWKKKKKIPWGGESYLEMETWSKLGPSHPYLSLVKCVTCHATLVLLKKMVVNLSNLSLQLKQHYPQTIMKTDTYLVSEGPGSWWLDNKWASDQNPSETITIRGSKIPCKISFDLHEKRNNLDTMK